MPSADLEAAVRTAVKARTINNGQSCIAAKRFIVAESIAEEFERRYVAGFKALKVGDPMDAATDIGPLANENQVLTIAEQVERSVAAGARLLTGGKRLDRPGYWYEPTVLTNVTPDSPAYYDEVFGPVAILFRARTVDDAIRLANDSPFGLGASAWTNDPAEQKRFVEEIEAGMVFINAMVASDPRVPFGGREAERLRPGALAARRPRVREREDGVGAGDGTRGVAEAVGFGVGRGEGGGRRRESP